jgi:hypothetical protein
VPAEIIRPDEFQKGYERLLRETGGGGDDGDMPPTLEARVSALETKVSEIWTDARSLVKDVAEIKGKLSNMPTTFQIVSWFVGVALGLVALVFTIARLMK